MANLKDVIYLSNEDYETLVTTGTVTIGTETLIYNEDNLYITPDKLASTTENGLMSAEDKVKLDTINTSSLGTVKSVSAGTGLSISGTSTVNPTVNIASGYQLMSDGTQYFSGNKGFDNLSTAFLYTSTIQGSPNIGDTEGPASWGVHNDSSDSQVFTFNTIVHDIGLKSTYGLAIPDTLNYTANRTIATLDDIESNTSLYQSTSVLVGNAVTNINGRVFRNYTATLQTAGGYTFYQILKSGSNPTEAEAKEYMRYMTGSYFLPKYNYDFPKQTIFIFADRSIWKPQYSSTDGLRLYRLTTPMALESEIPTIYESITWSSLKSKRDNSQLIPGAFYRITDYTCTTTISGTSSAGHQFDIIVRADGINKLNEEASAVQHGGDTYFTNNKLESWKLWYSLDNETSRFGWADSTNGKGVIYRMIDEFGNDCPYDFKNILFTRTNLYTNAYTFSYKDSGNVLDASIVGFTKGCYSNKMKEYINSNLQQLNFNVFYSDDVIFDCYMNTLDIGCFNNTFSTYFRDNKLGINCRENTFGGNCRYNVLDNNCRNNTFGLSCNTNCLGINCSYNDLCDFSTGNNLGNSCTYIKFGNSSALSTNYSNNTIDSGCSYIYLVADTSSGNLNYVHIHSGVIGVSSSNRKTITVHRNLAYTIDVYPIGSTEMFV